MTGNGCSDESNSVTAMTLDLVVLDRLLYRNKSQHRNAKYFNRVLEVARACRASAAPKLPGLLAEGLGLIAKVPDCRNGREREAWVRSTALDLRRTRAAVVACDHALESIVQASKHLAHQVSQTFFMPLSTGLLACLARLFTCNLHLGGRLLEVHGALLHTLLVQPCISECLSKDEMEECRIPEEPVLLLSHLRGQGSSHSTTRARTLPARTTTACSSSRTSKQDFRTVSSLLSKSSTFLGEMGGGGAGEDEDDAGVSIGRVARVEAEQVPRSPREVAKATPQGGRRGGAAAAAGGSGGRVGGKTTRTSGGPGQGSRRGEGRGGGGADGSTLKGRSAAGVGGGGGVGAPQRKVVLASEFSSSSDDDSEAGNTTMDSSARKNMATPEESSQASSASSLSRPSLFFSRAPRDAQSDRDGRPGDKTFGGAASAGLRLGEIDSGNGDGADTAHVSVAAPQTSNKASSTSDRVGLINNPEPAQRPQGRVDTQSSSFGGNRKRRARSSGRGSVPPKTPATPRDRGDGEADGRVDGRFSGGEGDGSAPSTVSDTAKPTGRGSPQNEPRSLKLRPDVAARGASAAGAAGAAPRSSAGEASNDCAGATAAGAVERPMSVPPAKEPSRPKEKSTPGRHTGAKVPLLPRKVAATVASETGEQEMQQRSGMSAITPRKTAVGTALSQPGGTNKKGKGVGGGEGGGGSGGVSGLKRGSLSGEGRDRDEKPRKKKKQKRKKGGRNQTDGKGGGGRDAIDDIFGSF